MAYRVPSPASPQPYSMDYTAPLTTDTLVVEVSAGAFCFANKVKPGSVKLLWERLCQSIAGTLKAQKGVLLPNLGTFRVGPVTGELRKKIRPVFTLLEGRYGGVSQERPRYAVGGRPAIVQPSITALSTATALHRGATQRLLVELLQRIGVHILSGRSLKVDFPSLGKLVTNRAGRLEFVFDPLFMEWFEEERQVALIEMPYENEHWPDDPSSPSDVVKGLQQVQLHSPLLKSPALSRPDSAHSSRPTSAMLLRRAQSPSMPYRGPLVQLNRLCQAEDRTGSGCVTRLQLEQWLAKEAKAAMVGVDAATMLELLTLYTYGRNRRHILYRPFLDALQTVVDGANSQQVLASPITAPASAVVLTGSPMLPSNAVPEHQRHEPPGGFDHVALLMEEETSPREVTWSPHDHVRLPAPTPTHADGSPYGEAESCMHYLQKALSPRSRASYDQFNRLHFDHIHNSRGPAYKRAVTPKVGEEPLNQQEMQAMRQSWDRLPTPVPDMFSRQDLPSPYGRPSPASQPQVFQVFHPDSSPSALPSPRRAHFASADGTPSALPQTSHSPYSNGNGQPYPLPPRAPSATAQQHSQLQQQIAAQQLQQQQKRALPPSQPQQQQQSNHMPAAAQSPQPWLGTPTYNPYPAGVPSAVARDAAAWQTAVQPPVSQPVPVTVSQYDVSNERDPVLKSQMKAELARELQQGWNAQIQQKGVMEQQISSGDSAWPFQPKQPSAGIGNSSDKRPLSGVSRPPSPLRTKGYR